VGEGYLGIVIIGMQLAGMFLQAGGAGGLVAVDWQAVVDIGAVNFSSDFSSICNRINGLSSP